MSLTMHRGSPARRRFTNLSRSPIRNRDRRDPLTPPKKSSSHRGRSKSPIIERANTHVRSSPRRGRSRSPLKEKQPLDSRSPKYSRARSPVNEKLSNIRRSPRRQSRSPRKQRPQEHGRSPKEVHSSSPIRDSSISPRTKRLRRAQIEHERGKTSHNEEARSTVREREKGRNRERAEDRGASDEKRLSHEKNDGRIRSSRHAHNHSSSPVERGHRSGHGIHSPHDEVTRTRVQNQDDHEDSVSRMKAAEDELEQKQKQKPSFELSGKLAEETNRVRGVTLLFTEPPDARKPDVRWRLYVFKAGEVLNEPLYVHRQSCYLFGRERRVADIPTDHPSCSKQHAVLQYRLVEKEQPDGLMSKQVRPYLMDLGSTNGTFLNDERVEPQRYYELREQDVVKFGNSSREYVVLHENSVK